MKNSNPENPEYKTAGGGTAKDKIFLLSIGEAKKYLPADESGRCRAASAAVENGAYSPYTWWRLRSPGSNSSKAANVYTNGSVNEPDEQIYSTGAVRPALWLDPALYK